MVKTALFSGNDPTILLLNKLLGELSQEEQIKELKTMLKNKEVWDNSDVKKVIPLLEVLEKLFDKEADFREHLMEIYNSIPIQKDGNKFYKEKIEAAPDLKIAILEKIIQGWHRTWATNQIDEEAEKCFLFLCKAYNSVPRYYKDGEYTNSNAKIESSSCNKLGNLFREYLKRNIWDSDELDQWILIEGIPDDILNILAHAQINKGKGYWVKKRTQKIQILKNQ